MLSSSMSPQLRPLFSKNRFVGQISSWFDYVIHGLSFSDSSDGVEPSAASDHRWKVQPSLPLAQAHAPTFWRGQFFARSDDHFHLTRNAFNPRVSPFPYYIIGFICKPIIGNTKKHIVYIIQSWFEVLPSGHFITNAGATIWMVNIVSDMLFIPNPFPLQDRRFSFRGEEWKAESRSGSLVEGPARRRWCNRFIEHFVSCQHCQHYFFSKGDEAVSRFAPLSL